MPVEVTLKPLAFALLGELSHERFVSGADLAARHGVSRSAVSDALKEASASGVEIFSLTRKGYRLAAPLELLDIDRIRAELGTQSRRIDVQLLQSIPSTNTELLKRAGEGAASGTCLAAEIQTAGRGRRGRVWQSALGRSLTFSLLWRFDRGVAQMSGLSLVVGLAIARALSGLGAIGVKVKWPNDIVVGPRKLAGILIETQGDMLGPTAAVIGVGVNIRLADGLRNAIDQPVTDMESLVPFVSRNRVLARLLAELVPLLDAFNAQGFAPMRDEWRGYHALQGLAIDVKEAGRADYAAIVQDVAADGSLVVRVGSETLSLNSAEISVRAHAASTTNAEEADS